MIEQEKKLNELLKEMGCHLIYEFDFPQYKILPPEIKLALEVLKRNQMVVRIVLKANSDK